MRYLFPLLAIVAIAVATLIGALIARAYSEGITDRRRIERHLEPVLNYHVGIARWIYNLGYRQTDRQWRREQARADRVERRK